MQSAYFLAFIWIIAAIFVTNSASDESHNLQHFMPQNDDPLNNNQRFLQIMQGSDFKWPEPKFKKEKIDVKTELDKLNITYVYQQDWPDQKKKLGVVSAVTFDVDGNVVIFHRVDRIWNLSTFNESHYYMEQPRVPISQNTVVAFDRKSGNVVYEWGKNLFYMPHGLTIDKDNNAWVTDVALHQVMKFGPKGSKDKPLMVLGSAFTPGQSNNTFCKPTAVAVLPDGDFFVADGYCNARIMKFSKEGQHILSWGRNSFQGYSFEQAPPNFFAIPHALTLALDKGLICAADRENGRVQCFYTNNGTFHSQYHNQLVGDRLFSVDYAPVDGGQLFVVNGPVVETYNEVRGYVIDMKTKQVLSKFGPNDMEFSNPHDIAVTPDGNEIYVAELDPNRVHKFLSRTVAKTFPMSYVKTTETVVMTKPQPGSTALLVVTLVVIFAFVAFSLALLISRRRKRGKNSSLTGTNEIEYSKLVSRSICDDC